MITDIMKNIYRWGNKYPVTRYRVEKVKNEKKTNNNKPKEKQNEERPLGQRIYIA